MECGPHAKVATRAQFKALLHGRYGATMRWAPSEHCLQCPVVAFCSVVSLVPVHRDGDTSM